METFILNTALDFDVDVDLVREYYHKYYEQGLFYKKLEEYIEKRAMDARGFEK